MASKHVQRQQQVTERRREVARLRLAGVRDQRELAARLGVSLGTINSDIKAINQQWERETTLDIDAEKRIDLARIEALIVVLWPLALAGKAHVVDRIVSLMQHKAKLLGLEAPQKQDLNLTHIVREYVGINPEDV